MTRSLSLRVNPLSGIHEQTLGCHRTHQSQQTNRSQESDISQDAAIWLGADDEAIAIRALIWQEGREMIASVPESLELAFEVLRIKSDCQGIKLEAHGSREEIRKHLGTAGRWRGSSLT